MQVYHSRPLVNLARSTPSGGRALHRFLRELLHRCAVYVPPQAAGAATGPNRRQNPVPLDRLTDRVVEQVLTKGCVVGGLPNSHVPTNEMMEVDPIEGSSYEDHEVRLYTALEARHGFSSFPARSFSIPHSTVIRDGQGTLVVPGWVLERAAEILFDSALGEEAESVPHTVLDTLLKVCPARHP